MEEKKVGILTFHRARNIGTCLQAYALQEYIKEENREVEFIDYRPQYIEDSFGIFIKELYNKAKGNARELLLFWIKTIIRLPFSSTRERKFREFRDNYLQISEKTYYKKEDLKETDQQYSHVFFGSDQIWNPQLTEGIDTIFFGDFGTDKIVKSSYAGSLGANVLSEEEKNKIKDAITHLDFVGVRENSAKEILEELGTKDVRTNVDPTLLVDEIIWENLAKDVPMKDKYILVYTLEINDELIKIVNDVAEKKNLKVVSLDLKNRYGKRGISRYSTDPREFLGLMKNAEYIITNSFHGTVFSIIFEKQFLSIPHKTRSTRVKDLLGMLGIQQRMVFTKNECIDIDDEIDFISAKDKLKVATEDSRQFVKEVLKSGKNE